MNLSYYTQSFGAVLVLQQVIQLTSLIGKDRVFPSPPSPNEHTCAQWQMCTWLCEIGTHVLNVAV